MQENIFAIALSLAFLLQPSLPGTPALPALALDIWIRECAAPGRTSDLENIAMQKKNFFGRAKEVRGVAEIFEHLGYVYEKEGKAAEAISSWKKAVSLTSGEEMKSRLQMKLGVQ